MLLELLIWPIILILIYLMYAFVTTAVIYAFLKPSESFAVDEIDLAAFYGEEDGPDKALIIENRPFSLNARINLIENARLSIKIAYFAITDGIVSDVFYGQILEAANRGVVVQIIFDGMGQNLIGEKDSVYWALVKHPFINLRFYEKNQVLTPWRWNNIMHDKILIVDDKYAMTGGRNLEDRFHLSDYEGESVEDRDVLIIRKENRVLEESSISQFISYFNELWSHPYSRRLNRYVPAKLSEVAHRKQAEAFSNLNELKQSARYGFNQTIDWEAMARPTRKITLVSNPIQRLKRDPQILKILQALFQTAKESIFAQSPFIVPGKEMQKYFDFGSDKAAVYYLTNSSASSPNLFALSGQNKYMTFLSQKADQLYEYHGQGSIHGKSYVIDSRLSLIGSFNLDPRSAFLSTENMVIIDSVPLAQDLTAHIMILMQESVPFLKDGPHLTQNLKQAQAIPKAKKRRLTAAYWLLYFFEDIL